MKNTVLPYIFKAFICPLVLLTSCSVEETGPSEPALGNEVKVNVSASEIPAATKTTFDGETLVWSGNETMGILLADGQKSLMQYPYKVWCPAIVISLLMIAFNLLANGLRDAFDPTQRGV